MSHDSLLSRYKAASILRMYNKMITMRLLWVLDNVEGLREAADRNEIMFGCVDSWLLYKLTGKHLTEGQPSQRLQTQLDKSLTS